MVFRLYENEQTIFACGNGGNVASVQNLVVDMNMFPFVSEDKEIRLFHEISSSVLVYVVTR